MKNRIYLLNKKVSCPPAALNCSGDFLYPLQGLTMTELAHYQHIIKGVVWMLMGMFALVVIGCLAYFWLVLTVIEKIIK